MIRKPPQADRPSGLRRTAEAAIDAGEDIKGAGRRAGSCLSRIAGIWLIGMMSFGALTAGSLGGMIIGLIVVAALCLPMYLASKRRRISG